MTAQPQAPGRPAATTTTGVVDRAVYVEGRRVPGWTSLADALATARAGGGFLWIGLHAPVAADMTEIADVLGLPPLAVEDAVTAHQRPKLERYGDRTFLVTKPVRYLDHEEVVQVDELAVFLTPEAVVTVRHGASDVPATVRRELEADPEMLAHGPGAVLYRCLDMVVDGYADVIVSVDLDVDQIEEQVFGGDERDHAQRIYALKREVLGFRRAVVPLTLPVQRLHETEIPGVSPTARDYFRDVHDHVLRAAEAVEGFDRLLTDVLQADLAQVTVRQNRVTARQNEDVRKISAWAAIALVPTLIAGIYGMNFRYMPELKWHLGYPMALGIMVLACVGLYALFRRNGWL